MGRMWVAGYRMADGAKCIIQRLANTRRFLTLLSVVTYGCELGWPIHGYQHCGMTGGRYGCSLGLEAAQPVSVKHLDS